MSPYAPDPTKRSKKGKQENIQNLIDANREAEKAWNPALGRHGSPSQ